MDELLKAANVKHYTGSKVLGELVDAGEVARKGAGKKGDPYLFWRPDPPGRGEASPGGAPKNDIHFVETSTPYATKTTEPVSAEEVAALLRRPNSGPRRNLPLYLRDETPLEILTNSVLRALGRSDDPWEPHAPVVEAAAKDANNHPLDCGCEGCA